MQKCCVKIILLKHNKFKGIKTKKKFLTVLTAVVLMFSFGLVLTACGKGNDNNGGNGGDNGDPTYDVNIIYPTNEAYRINEFKVQNNGSYNEDIENSKFCIESNKAFSIDLTLNTGYSAENIKMFLSTDQTIDEGDILLTEEVPATITEGTNLQDLKNAYLVSRSEVDSNYQTSDAYYFKNDICITTPTEEELADATIFYRQTKANYLKKYYDQNRTISFKSPSGLSAGNYYILLQITGENGIVPQMRTVKIKIPETTGNHYSFSDFEETTQTISSADYVANEEGYYVMTQVYGSQKKFCTKYNTTDGSAKFYDVSSGFHFGYTNFSDGTFVKMNGDNQIVGLSCIDFNQADPTTITTIDTTNAEKFQREITIDLNNNSLSVSDFETDGFVFEYSIDGGTTWSVFDSNNINGGAQFYQQKFDIDKTFQYRIKFNNLNEYNNKFANATYKIAYENSTDSNNETHENYVNPNSHSQTFWGDPTTIDSGSLTHDENNKTITFKSIPAQTDKSINELNVADIKIYITNIDTNSTEE